MRTTYRMMAAGALSLPLVLGASGVAAANTDATVEVSEDPVVATQFQGQDRSADEQRNADVEARTTEEDDGFVIDLTTNLLGANEFDEGQYEDQDEGILGGILQSQDDQHHNQDDNQDEGILGGILQNQDDQHDDNQDEGALGGIL